MPVFISHSKHDLQYAKDVCSALEGQDIECWMAKRDIRPGQTYDVEMPAAMRRCRLLILLLSKASANSPEVRRELSVREQVDIDRPLFLVETEVAPEDGDLTHYISRHQRIAHSSNRQAQLDRIVSETQFVLNRPPTQTAPDTPKLGLTRSPTNSAAEAMAMPQLRTTFVSPRRNQVRRLNADVLSSDGSLTASISGDQLIITYRNRHNSFRPLEASLTARVSAAAPVTPTRALCVARLGARGVQVVVKTNTSGSLLLRWDDDRYPETQRWETLAIEDALSAIALGRDIAITDSAGSLHWPLTNSELSDPSFASAALDAALWGRTLILLRVRKNPSIGPAEILVWPSTSLSDALDQGQWEPVHQVLPKSLRSLGLIRQSPGEAHGDDILLYTEPASSSPLTGHALGLATLP